MKNKTKYLPLISFGNCVFLILLIITLLLQFILFPKGFGYIWTAQAMICVLWAYINIRFYRSNFKFSEVLKVLKQS